MRRGGSRSDISGADMNFDNELTFGKEPRSGDERSSGIGSAMKSSSATEERRQQNQFDNKYKYARPTTLSLGS